MDWPSVNNTAILSSCFLLFRFFVRLCEVGDYCRKLIRLAIVISSTKTFSCNGFELVTYEVQLRCSILVAFPIHLHPVLISIAVRILPTNLPDSLDQSWTLHRNAGFSIASSRYTIWGMDLGSCLPCVDPTLVDWLALLPLRSSEVHSFSLFCSCFARLLHGSPDHVCNIAWKSWGFL